MLPTTLLTAKTVAFCIPYSSSGCSCVARPAEVEGIVRDAAETRRRACANAAVQHTVVGGGGSVSDDDDEAEVSDDRDPTLCSLTIRVRQPAPAVVAGSIGSKLWDASLLMSSWLLENPSHFPQPKADGRRPRVLELGAGLGLVGLALSLALPTVAVTLSDYDTAVLLYLDESIRLNFPLGAAAPPETALVDFRDFGHQSHAAFLDGGGALDGALRRYAAEGLLGAFDLIIASDVVYSENHSTDLATVLLALLKPEPTASQPGSEVVRDADWQPCALLCLPDSRPRLSEFVAGLHTAGLCCRIERVERGCRMSRRLRREFDGWGADASFSMYHVTRAVR